MEPLSFLTALVVGLGLGLGSGWAMARARGARENAERETQLAANMAATQARLEATAEQAAVLEDALAETRREASGYQERLAMTTAALQAEQRTVADRQSLLEQTDHRLREAFASLSAKALQTNNQSFLELARASLSEYQKQATTDLQHRQQRIGDLLQPLHESLARVDAKLQQVEKERVGSYSQLSEQLRTLALTTTNLERALRTPNVRGGWGEVQLRRVVEMAGMVNHCHFVEKKASSSDDGRFIPDLIIKLPDQASGRPEHHRRCQSALYRLPGGGRGLERRDADGKTEGPCASAARAHHPAQ